MKSAQHGGIVFRLLTLLVLCALIALVYVARYPLLRALGSSLITEDRVDHADAIVVLGDDNFAGDRATRAAQLFHAGWAPQIIASGRMLRPYAGVAELIEKDLQNRGVPPTAIFRFAHHADNTREEAEALRGLVMQRGWRHILLVTSNYHTRRARFIFSRVFPASVTVTIVAAQDAQFDPNSWWQSRLGRKLFFLESAGYFQAMWELSGTPPVNSQKSTQFPLIRSRYTAFSIYKPLPLYYSRRP